MADMATIETAVKIYAQDLSALYERINIRDEEIKAITEKHDTQLNTLYNVCEASLKELYGYLSQSPELFENPKTRVFDLIKVGFIKEKDRVEFSKADEPFIIERIRTAIPDKYTTLVKSEYSLSKTALKDLHEDQLTLIGVDFIPGKSAPSVTLTKDEMIKSLKEFEKQIKKVVKS